MSMAGARSTSSRKMAAQASQRIIDQYSITPPKVLLCSSIAEDSSAASAPILLKMQYVERNRALIRGVPCARRRRPDSRFHPSGRLASRAAGGERPDSTAIEAARWLAGLPYHVNSAARRFGGMGMVRPRWRSRAASAWRRSSCDRPGLPGSPASSSPPPRASYARRRRSSRPDRRARRECRRRRR